MNPHSPQSAPEKVTVLVIGAGPVGLTMACGLRLQGIPCRIIDEQEGPTPLNESRALGIWERTQEVFDALGVIAHVLAAARKIHGLNGYSAGRRLIHVGLDLETGETPYPFVLFLPQGQTERILIQRLAGLGVQVERRTRLTGLQQDRDGVSASLLGPEGREMVVRADWLIGCDGSRSAVRHGLGLNFEGAAYEEPFRLADVQVEWPIPDDEVHIFLLPDGGGLACFPLPEPGRWRLVDASGVELAHEPDRIVERLLSLLHANGHPETRITAVSWVSSFRIQRRMVDRFRAGRCFVAGDAAHIHSPLGGQGMNTGIQDAHNLAWKLGLVVAGAAPESLLDSYDAERRPVAQAVLRGTDRMTEAVTLRSHAALGLRNTLASFVTQFDFVRRRIARTLSELDIDYRRSPIVAEDRQSLVQSLLPGGAGPGVMAAWDFGSGPRPGDRLPDVVLGGEASQRQHLVHILSGARHTLLLFGLAGSTAEDIRSVEAIGDLIHSRYRDRINAYLVVPPEPPAKGPRWEGARLADPAWRLHHRLGVSAPALYLIRPDGYVGYRSQPPDAGKLAAYLGRLGIVEAHNC